jgi:putative DNA primase/helicase
LSPQWLKEHREQIFAEAVYRFKLGEDWWDVPLVQAKVETEERRPEDPWEEVIAQYVEEHRTYSARELLVNPLLIDLEKHSNAAAKRVGAILRRLGWSNYVARVGDTTVKRWRKVSDVS